MAFEYLAAYTTFTSVAEMDKSVEDHMAAHYYDLTPAERAIVFKLASHSLATPGACHLKAATIAVALEISTRTVYRAIKKLEQLGIIKKEITIRGKKGGQGANIYIILPYVTPHMAERENADTGDNNAVCPPQFEEGSISSFNLLSSKQVNNIYELENELALQTEKKKTYMNEHQQMLFDFMHSLPIRDNLKDELHKCVLATKLNNMQDFLRAKNALFTLINNIVDGTVTVASTLRAVFAGGYNKAVKRRADNKLNNSPLVGNEADRERPVPFYNWLKERDSSLQINNYRPIDNWLEW